MRTMDHRGRIRSLVAIIGMLLMSLAIPATAATTNGSTEVSCDGNTIKNATTVAHGSGGTLSVKQNSSSPASSTYTTGRSSSGNELAWKLVGDGGTVSWTGVLSSNYTIRAYRNGASNCNGAWPGNGNYTWGYTITHNP